MNIWSSAEKSHTEQWLKGWAFSMTFHALVVVAAVTAMPKMTLVPEKELFTWDVSLVEAPRREPAPEPSPVHTESTKPTTPNAQPTPPTPQPVTRQIETRPVVETVQREVRQVVEAVQPLQEIVRAETPSSVVISKPEAVVSEKPTETTVVAKAEAAAVEQPAPAAPAVMPSSPSGQITHQPVVTQPAQSQATASSSADPELPQRTTGEAHETAPPAVRTPDPQVALATKPVPATKADYGWLAESLHRRILELRQYPSVARLNGWQGKVVLRVVIKDDGHLDGVAVVSSSGFEALDQAAIEAVRRACPLKMKHELGRPTVVVQVPVSYTLAN